MTAHSIDQEQYWLVVEDDENEFLLFSRACQRLAPSPPRLHWVKDGIKAQSHLSGNAPQPALIVSDLKMPGMDGLKLLGWAKTQPVLRGVPFMMLSNSNASRDREKARALGVDEYQVMCLSI